MNIERLVDAMGDISEEWIVDAEEAAMKLKKGKHRFHRPFLIAALVSTLFIGTVSAEVTSGTVSNLLAPAFGVAQTELVGKIGCPINASVTVEGYTLTADAVVGDRYNIFLSYTLKREDGAPLPDGLHFDSYSNSLYRGGGGGFTVREYNEDHTQIHFVQEWTSSRAEIRFWHNAQVIFSDLYILDDGTGERTILCEGDWELNFNMRYQDTTIRVPIEELKVTGAEGNVYQIQKIFLSSVGIHMDMTAPNHEREKENARPLPDFEVQLRKTDGTVVTMTHNHRSASGDLEAERLKASYGTRFSQPILVEDIEALLICGKEVPVSKK